MQLVEYCKTHVGAGIIYFILYKEIKFSYTVLSPVAVSLTDQD